MKGRKRYIELEWPELDQKARAKLADDKNPSICNFLLEHLPIHILQSHAMVSGDVMLAFHNITREFSPEFVEDYTDQQYWGKVPAAVGCICFKTSGYQAFIIQWGPERTEYELRVPVAYVEPEDLQKLAFVGRRVFEGMSTGKVYTLKVTQTN